MRKKEPKSDFERPPNTRIRIDATIDEKLLEQMKRIHEAEVKAARDADRVPPDWSNTVEMILRKGAKAYRGSSS